MAADMTTVTTAITQILDGTQTIDTLITNGSVPLAYCGGSTAGFTFLTGTPIGAGEKIVIPALLAWNAIADTGTEGVVWETDFGT